MQTSSSESKKPLFILGISLALIVILMVLFSALAISQIRQLNQVAKDFYIHPFTVNNAAVEFKSDIAQMRLRMLQLAQNTIPDKTSRLIAEVAVNDADARRQLGMILNGFLGDTGKVYEISEVMDEWAILRADIIPLVHEGRNAEAMQLASARGADIYERVFALISYISSYAHNKAMTFEHQAQVESGNMINNLYWIMALIIALIIMVGAYILRLFYYHNCKLEQDAFIDGLTGLLNRQQFHILSEQAIRHAGRYNHTLALMILDLDHFKDINDTYGHSAGDAVIKALSRTLIETMRDSDIICRWGGEEFVILMSEIDIEEATNLANRIKLLFAGNSVYVSGQQISTTVSIGVTAFTGQPGIEAMINEADQALYQAKEHGRNRVVVFTPASEEVTNQPPIVDSEPA